MARKVDIQYIRFYTDGNVARKAEPFVPYKQPSRKPRLQRKKRIRICIDPIATIGLLVTAVMLVLMAVGVAQLKAAGQETAVMGQYVMELQEANEYLHTTYEQGYDLESVERLALALGMVPKDQLSHILIQLPQDQEVVEPGFWERICGAFTELFA